MNTAINGFIYDYDASSVSLLNVRYNVHSYGYTSQRAKEISYKGERNHEINFVPINRRNLPFPVFDNNVCNLFKLVLRKIRFHALLHIEGG